MWTEQIKGITLRPLRSDADQHMLVALVDGLEVGSARLVRNGAEAEIAVVVADDREGRRVGTVLADRLAADARAAGINVVKTPPYGVVAASWARSRCACASATRRRAAAAPR